MATMSAAQAAAALHKLGAEGMGQAVRRALATAALDMEGGAKLNAETVLNVRSGHLRRSIAGTVRQGADGPEAVVSAGGRLGGANVTYAGTHEFGATIVPKRSQYLRIPLPPALTAAGVDRFGGPLRQSGAGLFRLAKSKKGNLLLIHKPSGMPWYVLKRSVTIRARPFLRPAGEATAGRLGKWLGAELVKEMRSRV